jgi:hypothetical protein
VYYLVCDSAGENVGEKGKGDGKERKTSVTTGLWGKKLGNQLLEKRRP